MRCVVCDSTDKWEQLDKDNAIPDDDFKAKYPGKFKTRLKEEGMSICTNCGFVSYPKKWKSKEAIVEFHRADYRPGPSVANWHAGQRKLHFHNAFLQPVFKEWDEKKLDRPVVAEIGAAYGLFLNYMREVVPGCQVHGTELTLSYRRTAYHEFGLELGEEFDDTIQYDMIASYKVAEHMLDVDKEFRRYALALKPGGYFYVSVPTWFNKLTNFGAGGFDLEYYYHPNHINVWSKKLFKEVLRRAGFKIQTHNDSMYDDTYLCVRDDEVMKQEPAFEDVGQVMKNLEAIYKAGISYMEGRFEDAIATWPNFPGAHQAVYEGSRAKLHQQGPEAINAVIQRAIKECNGCVEVLGLAADINTRYEKYSEAIKFFEKMLELRPGFAPAIKGISHALRQVAHGELRSGRTKDGLKHLAKAREVARFLRQVSDADVNESINWTFDDNSRLPMPSELGKKSDPVVTSVQNKPEQGDTSWP